MKGSYTYPAVISRHEDYADITFPDFDIATCSESAEPSAVIEAAQELLAAAVSGTLDSGESLPAPSERKSTEREDIVYIHIWLPYFRANEKIVYTKKTLTIPVWLDIPLDVQANEFFGTAGGCHQKGAEFKIRRDSRLI